MGSEHEPAIVLDAVIHWITLTLFKVCIYLWSQNVLETHNLKFFTGEIQAWPSSLVAAMRALKPPFFRSQGWNL